jgi:hypothetical protein
MNISTWFIRDYLDVITVCWFNHHDLPPESNEAYRPLVLDMARIAEARRELDILRIAIEHILANPEINCEDLGNSRFPFDDEEIRVILFYAWKVIWPNADPIIPGGPAGVKLVHTPLKEWQTLRKGSSI